MTRSQPIRILMTILTFVALAAGVAQAQTMEPPAPQPPKQVRFPDFAESKLVNGLRVIVVEHHEQPSVSLRLITTGGRLFEPAGQAGLADATATLLTEGTTTRSAQEIAQAIDFVGGGLSTGSGWDSSYASAYVTSDQLDLGLELLSDIVMHPAFAAEELERWRRQTLSGLQVSFEDPAFLSGAVFDRLIFGQHPYGHPSNGTPASVAALTRDDLVEFHRTHYLPNTSILAVVGDVDPEKAVDKVARHFTDWKRGEAPPPPSFDPPQWEEPLIVVIDKPEAVQTEIRVGQVGLAKRDDDFFTSEIYNSVLGGSSSARLFVEIREKRGLTYGAYSRFRQQKQPGSFRMQTYTKTESTMETLDVLLEVVQGMAAAAVPAEELDNSKLYLTGAFPLQIETPDGIASQVLSALVHGYDKEYIESYRNRLDSVSAEEVLAFARERIHPGRMVVVMAGNAAAFAKELENNYGEVTIIPLTELDLLRPDLRRATEVEEPAAEAQEEAAPSG